MGTLINNKNIVFTLTVLTLILRSAESETIHRDLATVDRRACLTHAHELLGKRASTVGEKDIHGIEQFIYQRIAQSQLAETSPRKLTEITRTIIEESNRYHFDPMVVLAVIEHESNFNTNILGRFGEIGLMQIKPTTARWIQDRMGIRPASAKIQLRDPVENIRFGTAYLAFLKSEFKRVKGSTFLAAYNMGPSNLRKVLKQRLTPRIYPDQIIQKYVRLHGELKQVSWALVHQNDRANLF